MQLSARILTALAVLAFTVAIVARRKKCDRRSQRSYRNDRCFERGRVHDHQR